ncbi:hypothetical protein, conserved [Angomonas deanei]|uniref:Uncharacterized protein n=1 Tax=Angomonas deanei TaxID=59799 RepID=A0A7G2CND3_9TRYP|nr:hypothetical protein, conserved [Angomonas deanei]
MSTSSAAPSWEVRELPDKPDGISFFSPDRTMQDVVHSTDQIVQDFFDEVKQRHQRENLISQSRQTALAEYDPHLSSTTIMAREREADWRRYVQKCKQLPHDREEDQEWGNVAKFRQKETFREMLSEVTKSLYDREKNEESSPTIAFLTTEGVKRQYREKAERQLVLELCFAVKPFVKELLLLLMQYAEKDHQRGGQGSALFHPERTASSVTLAQCAEAMNELFSRYQVRTTRATSTLCGKIVSFTGDAAACSVHRVEYALFVSAIVQKANEPPD